MLLLSGGRKQDLSGDVLNVMSCGATNEDWSNPELSARGLVSTALTHQKQTARAWECALKSPYALEMPTYPMAPVPQGGAGWHRGISRWMGGVTLGGRGLGGIRIGQGREE